MNIVSAKDSKPSSSPIKVEVFEKTEGGKAKSARFSFPVTPPGGPFVVGDVEDLWLTVKGKAEEDSDKSKDSK